MDSIGGIKLEEVIKFQVRIMFGAQYNRVVKSTSEKEIIIACLRVAWNDAFRHVSVNKYEKNSHLIIMLYKDRDEAIKDLNLDVKDDDTIVSEYICQKIFGMQIVFETFEKYVKANNTQAKVCVIEDALKNSEFTNAFGQIKVIDDDEKSLCFGHIQKLFNMALKYYICLYFCRDILEISEYIGKEIITESMMEYAECPIDSVILKMLDERDKNGSLIRQIKDIKQFRKFTDIKWSKIGKEEFPTEIYIKLQEIIGQTQPNGKSNLYFDFENWG